MPRSLRVAPREGKTQAHPCPDPEIRRQRRPALRGDGLWLGPIRDDCYSSTHPRDKIDAGGRPVSGAGRQGGGWRA